MNALTVLGYKLVTFHVLWWPLVTLPLFCPEFEVVTPLCGVNVNTIVVHASYFSARQNLICKNPVILFLRFPGFSVKL